MNHLFYFVLLAPFAMDDFCIQTVFYPPDGGSGTFVASYIWERSMIGLVHSPSVPDRAVLVEDVLIGHMRRIV